MLQHPIFILSHYTHTLYAVYILFISVIIAISLRLVCVNICSVPINYSKKHILFFSHTTAQNFFFPACTHLYCFRLLIKKLVQLQFKQRYRLII